MDKVSVIIPTYRRPREMVKRAVDSVAAQTYKNIEIVLVDDNAAPENIKEREAVFALAAEYDVTLLTLVTNPAPCGGAVSRNNGIAASAGDYITFLDDDDRYLPDKIEKQLAYMKENELDMCFTELRLVNSAEKTVDYREFSKIPSFDMETLLKYHLMHNITGTPTFMYKRELIERIGGFEDVRVSQEYYLMMKTIQADAKIGYYTGCGVVAYRHGGPTISSGKTKIIWEKKLYKFKQKYFDLLTKKEQRYVRFRYYAILSVSSLRSRDYIGWLFYGAIGALSSPVTFVSEFTAHLARKSGM